jgi:hypothetical protein
MKPLAAGTKKRRCVVEDRGAFWEAFWNKRFDEARDVWAKLSPDGQRAALLEMFQLASCARTPSSISVLFRELHEGRTFEEFRTAKKPPADHCKPVDVEGIRYEQFFEAPVRVVNAIDLKDPHRVVSVSFNWLTPEQQQKIWSIADDPANAGRSDAIAPVADKTLALIALTQSDDNLGAPF